MFALLKKELSSFFSSLIAYIVIIVFLVANGLFMWVFPGQFNVLDMGYANIDTIFIIAPWVFLFLIPAITMRLFADEKRTGTMEFILTKPISDTKIVLAKYLAGLLLALFSLIPTLIYFVSIYFLGETVGNIDTGATWGSYIGLLFLAATYTAVGIFTSSITENQIVSFIFSAIICFFIYIGFESIGTLSIFKGIENIVINLGINEHYKSISRGVVDSRDIIYFVSVIFVFLLLTKIMLEKRNWEK